MATYNQPVAIISSDKDVDYTGALIQNAFANANLPGLPDDEGVITGLRIISDEQLAWQVDIFSSDTFSNADLDLDTFLGGYRFAEGDGIRYAGAGPYYYDISHLDLPYRDTDGTRELHVRLTNRSAAAKTAGAAGEIVVRALFEPFRNVQA